MPSGFAIAVVLAYGLVLGLLFLHGLAFLRLTVLAIRNRSHTPPATIPTTWPSVTVQLPIYNERYVATRLIDAVAAFAWPGLLEIQVLDDSTDDTRELVAAAVAGWRRRGVDIVHLHRTERTGYKAGALAAGLRVTRGELIAIFDADFEPDPDFLVRAVPVLAADPGLAFVQARWEHSNPDASLLARVQALAIDGHFVVEQQARWSRGDWFNFNGTAGIWRRAAIEDAGGWRADTLTEDLDLSYRAFLRGWRAAYVRAIGVRAELPVGIGAYRRQQSRWARGSLECAWALVPAVVRARAPASRRLFAVLHLTGYGIHLLLLATSILYPLILVLPADHGFVRDALRALGIFGLPALAPSLLFLSAQGLLGRPPLRAVPGVAVLTLVGVGMMANTARVAVAAVVGRAAGFERTPKYGDRGSGGQWRRLHYQPPADASILLELPLAAMNGATAAFAVARGMWVIAFFAGLFAAGLLLVAGLSIAETARGWWIARAAEPAQGAASTSIAAR